jgi:RNA polymerase-binding transcription factor DksA
MTMSTEFYNVDGELVAHRYWGGDARGTVVELQPDAVKVREMDEPLFGTDGSQENLRTLADWVGRNRLTPADIVERERERAAAFRAARQRDMERTWAPTLEPGPWGNCEHCGEAFGPRNPRNAHGLGRCKSL